MKIKLNNCPKCYGIVEFDDLTFFGSKHFYAKCTVCRLCGEYGGNKTIAAKKWNNSNIRFDEHEVKCRLIKMCKDEIEKTTIKSKTDDMYVSKLNDMIKYFGR